MDSESAASQLHRKLELQTPEDLAYLIANVRRAAAERLDEALPHVEGHVGEDELRNQVEALVHEYINKTFSLATPNLSINGLPIDPSAYLSSTTKTTPTLPDAYQPFDTRKRRHVADLITQEEKLLEEVASLKRSVPARAAAEQDARLRAAGEADDQAFQARVDKAAGVAVELGIENLERQRGVEAGFRGAVEGLGRLKRDMPAVVAKMERARVAGEYVVTEGR